MRAERRRPAASSFTTRADGHEKTNHGNERRGHHLHVALPIHTHFYLARMFASYLTDHCLRRALSPRPPPLPPFISSVAATESDRRWEEILFEFINLLWHKTIRQGYIKKKTEPDHFDMKKKKNEGQKQEKNVDCIYNSSLQNAVLINIKILTNKIRHRLDEFPIFVSYVLTGRLTSSWYTSLPTLNIFIVLSIGEQMTRCLCKNSC